MLIYGFCACLSYRLGGEKKCSSSEQSVGYSWKKPSLCAQLLHWSVYVALSKSLILRKPYSLLCWFNGSVFICRMSYCPTLRLYIHSVLELSVSYRELLLWISLATKKLEKEMVSTFSLGQWWHQSPLLLVTLALIPTSVETLSILYFVEIRINFIYICMCGFWWVFFPLSVLMLSFYFCTISIFVS